MKQHILLVLSILLLSVSGIRAQGEYLKRGESGVGFGLTYSGNSYQTAGAVSFGMSFNGTSDIGFSAGYASLDSGESVIGIAPGIVLHFLKQEPNGPPFSLSVSAGWEWDILSGTIGANRALHFLNLGSTLYYPVPSASGLRFQPFAGYFMLLPMNFRANELTGVVVGADVYSHDPSKSNIAFGIAFIFTENIVTFQMGLALFSITKSRPPTNNWR